MDLAGAALAGQRPARPGPAGRAQAGRSPQEAAPPAPAPAPLPSAPLPEPPAVSAGPSPTAGQREPPARPPARLRALTCRPGGSSPARPARPAPRPCSGRRSPRSSTAEAPRGPAETGSPSGKSSGEPRTPPLPAPWRRRAARRPPRRERARRRRGRARQGRPGRGERGEGCGVTAPLSEAQGRGQVGVWPAGRGRSQKQCLECGGGADGHVAGWAGPPPRQRDRAPGADSAAFPHPLHPETGRSGQKRVHEGHLHRALPVLNAPPAQPLHPKINTDPLYSTL